MIIKRLSLAEKIRKRRKKFYIIALQKTEGTNRWSLVRGSFMLWKLKLGPQNCGRCRQVVVIRRWSLTQVWLYLIFDSILTKSQQIFFEQLIKRQWCIRISKFDARIRNLPALIFNVLPRNRNNIRQGFSTIGNFIVMKTTHVHK